MSSSGGPRAAGSGLKEEGKFRQRVDDHYRKMADAKKRIRLSGRLALAAALGFFALAGPAVVHPGDWGVPAAAGSIGLGLVAAGASRAATAAAGGQNTQKHGSSYHTWARALGALTALASAGAAVAVGAGVEAPETPLAVGYGVLAGLALIASGMGVLGASALSSAFEAQRRKANK
jgi:hypothetical protein